MAKQPSLTVNVDSKKFDELVKNFTNLTKQMQSLNSHFKNISDSMNKSAAATKAAAASLSMMKSAGMSLLRTMGRITRHFLTWGTIIGGITALLGMGGGLFGIERLAASILAKRRMVLGLGGDYGRVQAAQIFGQGLMSNPTAALQNVAAGLHGDPDKMRPLLAAGIDVFGGKLDPDEVLDKVMERASDAMRAAGPQVALRIARAYGFDQLIDVPTLIRLTTDEGREQLKIKKELTAKYKEEMKISPRAQKAWAELSMQLQAAGAQIQTFLGESLADLAEPLKELSEGFAHLVKTLLESKTMRDIIKSLGDTLKKWAEQLKGITEQDIKAFFDDFKGVMGLLKNAFHVFTFMLERAVPVLRWIATTFFGWKQNWGHRAFGERWLHSPSNPIGDWLLGTGKTFLRNLGATPAFGGTPQPGSREFRPPNAIDDMNNRINKDPMSTPPPAPTTPPGPTTTAPGNNSFTFNPNAPGVSSFFGTAVPSGTTYGNPNRDPRDYRGIYGQGALPFGLPGEMGAPFKPQSWNPAVQGMGPSNNVFAMMGGFGKSGSGQGPLDTNNWQSSRTTSLTIRNVPGANMFMTATGMTA